ncbi:MAG: hypothetical protein KDI10_06050 [Halioglobus sp.]|nr:hypothetical protein [Halioglobus sp.]
MSVSAKLGPVSQCTLVATDGEAAVHAYTTWLYQAIAEAGELDLDSAAAIGSPELAGCRYWLLCNTNGRRWLQVVECTAAQPRDSLHSFGWMALEVLVDDVDQLAARLLAPACPFELLRPAADLELSDRIRACQVRGPTGEVLYLTQVRGEVPPFELPICAAPVDHLFIPVLSTASRERSLAQYSDIAGVAGICFDTRITVLNQARGYDLDRRHPVATLQLNGSCLLEIDELANTAELAAGIYTGIACVAFDCGATADRGATPLAAGPFAGRRVSSHRGCAGERFALLYD